MQGTRVLSLVGKYPTCPGATKPVPRSYWSGALEAELHAPQGSVAPLTATRGCPPCSSGDPVQTKQTDKPWRKKKEQMSKCSLNFFLWLWQVVFQILFDSRGNWRPPKAWILSLNNKNLSTLVAVWAMDRKVSKKRRAKISIKNS